MSVEFKLTACDIASGDDFTTFTVTAVGAASPAERAGFQKGDVIARIDQKPAARFSLALLKAVLAADGTNSFDLLRSNSNRSPSPLVLFEGRRCRRRMRGVVRSKARGFGAV